MELGTTKFAKNFKDFSGNGVMSPNQDENPLFYDWTKIFVLYCDGSVYLGNRDEPAEYQGHKIYFRGGKNAIGIFEHLSHKYDFYNKDTIIMTGGSAGGIATFQWSNYLYEHAVTSKVYSIPDSGLFLMDYQSPIAHAKLFQVLATPTIDLIFDLDYFPKHLH